jgi:trans-2,3-dihydro-3-hydroxyanthranilate isomerase
VTTPLDFYQLDVFADGPFRGNQLAVFPDTEGLTREQMQSIASEMNLSETTFVGATTSDSYEVRIFTPNEELPFAGHPTIGTAWLLRHLGRVTADRVVQNSAAGATPLEVTDDLIWFTRPGTADADLVDVDPGSTARIASICGLDAGDVGLEARELGRPGRLEPAYTEIGIRQLMVPLKDLDTLSRVTPSADGLRALVGTIGAYCFTGFKAGIVRARGFFPAVGIDEDPATGSACAGLGIYLADRVGEIELKVIQGVEMGRPSTLHLRAKPGEVTVGGRSELIFAGRLETLP